MIILGIESSCDDTSAALLECSKSGCFVLRESTASQIAIHKKYGGVVPEIAGRMHAEKIIPLIEHVLDGQKPDVIAVASGPGLITGLIVGVEATRTLSAAWKIPLVSVNHMAGHIHSVEICSSPVILSVAKDLDSSASPQNDIKIVYPALALIASGGHTEIIKISGEGKYKMIGATRDDAAGECFDKAAKMLGLPYPGGPQISKLALEGKTDAIKFPRPMLNDNNFDFSFAGLKTSALYWLRDNKLVIPTCLSLRGGQRPTRQSVSSCHSEEAKRPKNLLSKNRQILHCAQDDKININDFCASFEQAIIDTLVGKMSRAIKKFKPKTVILCGGVSANKKLRETLATTVAQFPKTKYMIPEGHYCMDNAAMIARAGYSIVSSPRPLREYKLQRGSSAGVNKYIDWKKLKADPNWELGR